MGSLFDDSVNEAIFKLNDVDLGGGEPVEDLDSFVFHIVTKDDTLAGLAIKHKIQLGKMQRDNGMMSGVIHPGQKIKFPLNHACSKCRRKGSLPMNGGLLGGSTKTLKPPSGSSSPRKTASSAESISFPVFLDETIEPAFNKNDANGDGFWGTETEELKVTGPVSTVFGSDSRDFGPQANLPSGSRKTNDKEKNTTGHTPKSVERRPVTLIRGPSDIFSQADIEELEHRVLPAHWRGYNWELLYSVVRDGASYASLFERARHAKPSLVAVRTARGEVFGGFVTSEWEPQTGYFGTGECFLWKKLQSGQYSNIPDSSSCCNFSKYTWTHSNSFFMYCQENCFGMGGGGGHFGFFVGDMMERGTAGPCSTFAEGGPAGVGGRGGGAAGRGAAAELCSRQEFEVLNVEVWSFTAQPDQLKANLERLRQHFKSKARPSNRLYAL